MSENKKQKVITLTKPKHAEEFSLEECAAFQPWYVVLKVSVNEYDPEPVDYDVYCRAPSPDDAQMTAYSIFMIWAHPWIRGEAALSTTQYPQICVSVPSEAYALDESQWKDAFNTARKSNRFLYAGMKANPSIFRVDKKDWDKGSGLGNGFGKHSIIVPDTAAIASVQKQKQELDKKFGKK